MAWIARFEVPKAVISRVGTSRLCSRKPLKHFHAAQFRHADVHQQQVGLGVVVDGLEHFAAGACLADVEALVLEEARRR